MKHTQMIYWLSCAMDEVSLDGEIPSPSLSFLSDQERVVCQGLRFAKRRSEWLLGRRTAKQLLRRSLAEYKNVPLAEISVANDPDGAPYYAVGQDRLPLCLSISHRAGRAFCALSATHTIGADIERIEPREPAFVADFFTVSENAQVRAATDVTRDLIITLIWSAKESALKVLREGLRVDTRQIEVVRIEAIESIPASNVGRKRLRETSNVKCQAGTDAPYAWHPLHVECRLPGTRRFAAWWQIDGSDVLTLAAAIPVGSTDRPDIRVA